MHYLKNPPVSKRDGENPILRMGRLEHPILSDMAGILTVHGCLGHDKPVTLCWLDIDWSSAELKGSRYSEKQNAKPFEDTLW